MKRRLLYVAAFVAALVPVGAVIAAPPASSAEILQVCITVTPKFVGLNINGIPVGITVPMIDRTCAGI